MSQGGRITVDSEKIIYANPSPEVLQRRMLKGIYRVEPDGLYKRCPRCSEYWPADTEFFYSAKREPDGLNIWCKACYIEWRWPGGRPSEAKPVVAPIIEEEYDELEAA